MFWSFVSLVLSLIIFSEYILSFVAFLSHESFAKLNKCRVLYKYNFVYTFVYLSGVVEIDWALTMLSLFGSSLPFSLSWLCSLCSLCCLSLLSPVIPLSLVFHKRYGNKWWMSRIHATTGSDKQYIPKIYFVSLLVSPFQRFSTKFRSVFSGELMSS